MSDKDGNVASNIVSGIVRIFISIALPFAIRTVMIYVMGEEYLGLNSLYSSVLSFLNLAELGFSNAIVFHMYKPLVEGDDEKVCALLREYRKIYYYVGGFILTAGLVILPFISYFIKGSWPSDINIYLLFGIYLVNNSISFFFFSYKTSLLNATKRVDIVNIVQMSIYLGQYILQIVVLLLFRNYYVYIIITPIFTLLFNVVIMLISNKMYPQYQCKGSISIDEKKEISKVARSVFLYRIDETTRNSSNTIIISSYLGLYTVALFNNYYYIFSAIYSILIAINQAIQPIVGQSLVINDKEKSFKELSVYNFGLMWLITWCSICLICLIQPFMIIWMGETRMLSNTIAILFGVYFYVLNANNARNLYFDGSGLWSNAKLSYILEMGTNLVLNILFGRQWGITGVLIATILSTVIFNYCDRTIILFKDYFHFSPKKFFYRHFKHFIISIILTILTIFTCNLFNGLSSVFRLLVSFGICILVPNIGLWIAYKNNEDYLVIKDKVFSFISNRKKDK